MKILAVATNFPDPVHPTWAPWNKSSVDSIATESSVVAIVPRPLVPPFSKYSKIPMTEKYPDYQVYYPRFLYMLPKKLSYGATGYFFRLSMMRHISQEIEGEIGDVDIIHAFHPYLDGYGMVPISKKFGKPLVVTIHSKRNLSVCPKKVRETLKSADAIVTVSNALISDLKSEGIAEDKIKYVPLGVDIVRFKPINEYEKEIIKTKKRVQGKKIILFVGQLLPIKNVEMIIRSIPLVIGSLHSGQKDILFVIIGKGPEEKKLFHLTMELGVSSNVLFTGAIPHQSNDLNEWFSISDVFVLPSISEGKPVVIFEAMSSGCPIIASDVDGIPEQVKSGENGYLINPHDLVGFAQKIVQLVTDENLARDMGKQSRKFIFNSNYTWDDYCIGIHAVYKNVMDRVTDR